MMPRLNIFCKRITGADIGVGDVATIACYNFGYLSITAPTVHGGDVAREYDVRCLVHVDDVMLDSWWMPEGATSDGAVNRSALLLKQMNIHES